MNIKITTFTNPFSFFCVNEDSEHNSNLKFESQSEVNKILLNQSKIQELDHGQYIAALWKKKWTRGVISMEKQFLIWLIDYGIYLRPNDKIHFIDLPLEYKKLPTKVFEASIHGIVPIDKVLTDDCQIKNNVTTSWTEGCIEKSQELIKNALRVYFQPIALLTTMHNHVVIGDLFLDIQGKGIVNIIDELEAWPVFLERNEGAYITSFTNFYTSRRKHRLCCLKPHIPEFELPCITLKICLENYKEIVAKSPKMKSLIESESIIEDGSTVVGSLVQCNDKSAYKITPKDIEKYAGCYVTINGSEYNVLSILMNKARDLSICERYKDHDLISVGRGISYKRSNNLY